MAGETGPTDTLVEFQMQLTRFRRYHNTVRRHRAVGRRAPVEAYGARPNAFDRAATA